MSGPATSASLLLVEDDDSIRELLASALRFGGYRIDTAANGPDALQADATYQAFNSDAYQSGTILPNAGHLRVTVSPEHVQVDYVRSFLPKDETPSSRDGSVADSYIVTARR